MYCAYSGYMTERGTIDHIIEEELSKYYQLKGIEYFDDFGKGKFRNWCDDNGYDTDEIAEELNLNAFDCSCTNFDDQFPTSLIRSDLKTIEIYIILKMCFQSTNLFDGKSSTISTAMTRILNETKTTTMTSYINNIEKFGWKRQDILHAIDYSLKVYRLDKVWIQNQERLDIITEYLTNKCQQRVRNNDDCDQSSDQTVISFYWDKFDIITSGFYRSILIYIPSQIMTLCNVFCGSPKLLNNNVITINEPIKDIYLKLLSNRYQYKEYKHIGLGFALNLYVKYPMEYIFRYFTTTPEYFSKHTPFKEFLCNSEIVKLTVLNDFGISGDDKYKPQFRCIGNMILNIRGNLIIGYGATIECAGNLNINVDGDVVVSGPYAEIKASTKHVGAVINIKCKNLRIKNGTISTMYGQKYEMHEGMKYGSIRIDVQNDILIAGKIESGNVEINCGNNMEIKHGIYRGEVRANRNNININANNTIKIDIDSLQDVTALNKIIMNSKQFQIGIQ